MRTALLLLALCASVPSYSQKTGTLYQEVTPPQPLSVFEHNKATFRNAFLVKIGQTDCFVKIESGMLKIPLAELPEPQRERYWTKPQAELAKVNAEKVAAWKQAEEERLAAATIRAQEDEKRAADEQAAAQMNAERRAQESERIARAKASSEFAGTLIVIAAVGLVYFLPSIIGRHKRNASAIVLLNFFLGWTFVGWVAALVWSVCKDPKEPNPKPGD
jgi:hypothetical protein